MQKHRNNIKATWCVLNDIKNCSKNDFPTYFVKNDNSIIENTEEIANEFNDFFFFLNVGPNLAKKIRDVDNDYDFAFNSSKSRFLDGVCESVVLEVVRKFKNKKSTDDNTIDMTLIKDVIVFSNYLLIYVINPFKQAFFLIK